MATRKDILDEREKAELKTYRREAKVAADELGYGDSVISDIDKAKTKAEITRIMKTARERRFG